MQTQRKTLMGINLLYDISKNLSVGGTLMHYYEKPIIAKTAFGDEASKNTLWGANLEYRKQSYMLPISWICSLLWRLLCHLRLLPNLSSHRCCQGITKIHTQVLIHIWMILNHLHRQ